MAKYYVIHLEDQVSQVSAFPNLIFCEAGEREDEFGISDLDIDVDVATDSESVISFSIGDRDYEIRYLLFEDAEEFIQSYESLSEDSDSNLCLVLLDAYEGEEPRGVDLYKQMFTDVDNLTVRFCTAYPSTVAKSLSINQDDEILISKPLGDQILSKLLLELIFSSMKICACSE